MNYLENSKSLMEFGAKGNANYYDSTTKSYYVDAEFTIKSSDDTTAIQEAMLYSKTYGEEVRVPKGNYIFTEQLLWDKKISFVGIGAKYSAKFLKHFNGDGIRIETDYCILSNIGVHCSEKFRMTDNGSGVVMGNDTTDKTKNIRANYCKIDIQSMYHGKNGIDCQKGNECHIYGHYIQNRQDGVHCSSEWVGGAADWNANQMDFSAEGNGRHGLYMYRAETNTLKAVCQGNGWRDGKGLGALINWSGNNGFIYAEGNVGGQVTYGSSGYGNDISMHIVNQKPSYQNHKNVGFVNGTGAGGDIFFKLFYAHIGNATPFEKQTNLPKISANSYVDVPIQNVYGINNDKVRIIINPSTGLPQGVTYECFYSGAVDTLTLRIHNNSASILNLGSVTWYGLALGVLKSF